GLSVGVGGGVEAMIVARVRPCGRASEGRARVLGRTARTAGYRRIRRRGVDGEAARVRGGVGVPRRVGGPDLEGVEPVGQGAVGRSEERRVGGGRLGRGEATLKNRSRLR